MALRKKARGYNNAFAFTSVKCNQPAAPGGVGPMNFQIEGALYHFTGILLPSTGQEAFASVYSLNPDIATDRRARGSAGLNVGGGLCGSATAFGRSSNSNGGIDGHLRGYGGDGSIVNSSGASNFGLGARPRWDGCPRWAAGCCPPLKQTSRFFRHLLRGSKPRPLVKEETVQYPGTRRVYTSSLPSLVPPWRYAGVSLNS
ncbi:hypothetical protein B0T25DRAFT_146543 [Lasiosphaeria hispida]|uniref:Uncharacterized protein n=1 Tax=Lasiosphaeria hispida TaxID=260671 RepID=A0AAJ0MFU3_9PEZI|nr:hypothetical protein B0T25DRAFT_146543 [Lasiosphaeria hispida]